MALPVPDLVAHAPHHHARIIAIAADKIPQVPFPPVEEIDRIVVLGLIRSLPLEPAVPRFVHHHKAHRVAHGVKLRREGVVRRANRVASHLLQYLQTAVQHVRPDSRPRRRRVLMDAHALQYGRLAVEQKSLGDIVPDRPDAEARHIVIHLPSLLFNRRAKVVDLRRIGTPQLRFRYNKLLRKRILSRLQLCPLRPAGDFAPRRVLHRRDHRHPGRLCGHVADLHLRTHRRGLFVSLGRGDIGPRLRNEYRLRHDQVYRTVDARTGIPARRGLFAVVHAHRNDVPPALHIGCNVVPESQVSVRPGSGFDAVHPHGAVHKDPVEFQIEPLSLPRRVPIQHLLVPSDAARQKSHPAAARPILAVRTFDTEIVGYVEFSPPGEIHSVGETVFDIALIKIPVEIEVPHLPLGNRGDLHAQKRCHEQRQNLFSHYLYIIFTFHGLPSVFQSGPIVRFCIFPYKNTLYRRYETSTFIRIFQKLKKSR